MNVYRFKAEFKRDVEELMRILRADYLLIIVDDPLLDIEVQITTVLNINAVRRKMLQVPDGHMMAESLNYPEQYNGSRTRRR